MLHGMQDTGNGEQWTRFMFNKVMVSPCFHWKDMTNESEINISALQAP